MNNTENVGIKIEDNEFENNLLFYTMLKSLLKTQLTDTQLVDLQNIVKNNYERFKDHIIDFKNILLENNAIVNTATEKYTDYAFYISLCEEENYEMWCVLNEVVIDLMLVKDLILAESRLYATNKYRELIEDSLDRLSFEYDISSLAIPYGQRVMSSLLVYALTTLRRGNALLLSESNITVNNISDKISNINNIYKININNMFQLIMGESVSQSIRSTAGQSYENRVAFTLQNIVDELYGHSHDSKITSVEYDNTFKINDKLFGVSAKRTLRERYKQNFEDVNMLDVDYMFLITLGIDLNSEKVNNILQKQGIYIVVSSEVYNSKEYMQNNIRIISSVEFTREKIIEIIGE